MDWSLIVSSKQVVEGGWAAEARRLRSLLDVVSTCLETEYREPVVWSGEDLTVEQWADLNEVTAELERQQLRNNDGEIFAGGGSGSVVLAHRGNGHEYKLGNHMIGNHWDVGGDDEWQFNTALNFHVSDFKAGKAKPLQDHPVEWLVHLISATSACADAAQSRIETIELADELIDARYRSIVGGLTLAPNGIGAAKLPTSITAHPCPVGYPNGLVLVADMDRMINDPASLVDDLLTLDDILRGTNGSS